MLVVYTLIEEIFERRNFRGWDISAKILAFPVFVDVRKIVRKFVFADTVKIQVTWVFILVDHDFEEIFRGENPILY